LDLPELVRELGRIHLGPPGYQQAQPYNESRNPQDATDQGEGQAIVLHDDIQEEEGQARDQQGEGHEATSVPTAPGYFGLLFHVAHDIQDNSWILVQG